jgi:voltage-gated potassium channel Kch
MNPALRKLSGRQVIVVIPEDLVIPRANIAPIVTLTAAADGGVALRPEELQALTIDGGAVDVVTSAVRTHPATIAIDSRITSSIAALGDQAPKESLAWASALGAVGLAQFGLPWADADPIGSLDIDTLTYARLGEYPWIHGDAITNTQLETLATRSASAVLVSSNSSPSDRAVVSIGQARVIRVDAQLSALATDALQAPTPLEAEADMQRAQGLIAYRALTGNQEILVFSTGRLPATAIAPRIDAVLGRLVSMPVSNSVAVPLAAPPTEVLSSVLGAANPQEYNEFVTKVRELWESDVTFATIASDPEGAVFGRWTRYQALLSSTWSENPNGLAAEWARANEDSRLFQNSVRVEQGSAITVLSDQTSLPVTVVNDLSSDVVVILAVRPTTGILAVETPRVRLTIAPGDAIRTLIPVQSLTNGTVPVEFALFSSGGESVGETVTIPVTIRAGWEGVISIGLAIIVGGTFAFGLIRAIQRRRADKSAVEEVSA